MRKVLTFLPPAARCGPLLRLIAWGVLLLGGGAGTTGVATAESDFDIRNTYLTVGHGWAVVRELRTLRANPSGHEIVLDDLPLEADLATLTIRARYTSMAMEQWSRVNEGAGLPIPDGQDLAVTWNPRQGLRVGGQAPVPAASPALAVVCRFGAAPAWERLTLDISYMVTGFDWQVQYQVAVRGEREDEKEPVSVDVTGLAQIHNGSSRSFQHAVIQLVGADHTSLRHPAREPGILVFPEDTPLADLWLKPDPDEPVEHLYSLPGVLDLPAQSDAQLYFAGVVRKSADRLYVMSADDFPLDSFRTGRSLRKAISFPNDAAHGLGYNLPAGAARIFIGGMRTHWLQDAWLPHTPAGREIRINLGLAENVKGLRRTVSQVDSADGFLETTYEMIIANLSGSDIRVEVSEKPPVVLEWFIVRSSKPYQLESPDILFKLDVPADTEERIEYRVKIRKPRY